MKLINFKNSDELNDLREKMDAPYQEWNVYEWEKLDADNLLEKLRSSKGILLEEEDLQELDIDNEGLFEYKGQRVLVYIRDQFYYPNRPDREYKYHISSCKTIEDMFQKGRKNRYVVTKNTSGTFWVREINRYTEEIRHEGDIQMNVCKNCLMHLAYNGYSNHGTDSKIAEQFKLEDFFDKYGKTKHSKLPDHDEKTAPINQYSKNFSDISTQYRKNINWKCEECGIDLKQDKRLLHLHHINGIRSDNNPNNLIALCIRCHAKRPDHSDLKHNQDYKKFIQKYAS